MGKTENYICPFCGGKMEFEDKWEDSLICTACGSDMSVGEYGMSADYYDLWGSEGDDEDIPEGCAACGGPYPDCVSSCDLFEE